MNCPEPGLKTRKSWSYHLQLFDGCALYIQLAAILLFILIHTMSLPKLLPEHIPLMKNVFVSFYLFHTDSLSKFCQGSSLFPEDFLYPPGPTELYLTSKLDSVAHSLTLEHLGLLLGLANLLVPTAFGE